MAEVEDRDDVRVAEPRCRPRLGDEHSNELRVRREEGAYLLDDDNFLEPFWAGNRAKINLGHPALRQLADDAIATDGLSRLERQGRRRLCDQPVRALRGWRKP